MSPSRRAFLRRAGAGSAGLPALPTDGVRVTREVTVLTRNLGLGTGLFGALNGDSVTPERVYRRFREVQQSRFPRRAAAIAADVARELPAIVGVQEAALVRRGPPGGPADSVVVDFLAELRRALDAATDVGYRPAVAVENVDESLPARAPDGEELTVRLTDRDVLFVREDVAVDGTDRGNYAVNVTAPTPAGTLTATRGWCLARVRVGAVPFVAADTHLSVASPTVRRTQAAELAARLSSVDQSVVLLADLNAQPDDPTLDRFAEYTDAAARVAGFGDAGATCCQGARLRNDRSWLSRRLDYVLARGADPLAVRRTDTEPSDRVDVAPGGDELLLWPSDHAGLVADLRVAPRLRDPLAVARALLAP